MVRLALLGLGLIGGSVGLAARRAVAGARVTGFDVDEDALRTARERGAIDLAAGSVEEALEGAEGCFACAPVGALPGLVEHALAAAPADCFVSDVGSTKRAIVAATDDERFVGGHPVAGAEVAGGEDARPDPVQGAAWDLTPRPRQIG